MGGGVLEIHRDSEPFAFGTHTGPYNSTNLKAKGKDFKSCGVQAGVLIKNITQGAEGLTVTILEDEIVTTMTPAAIEPLIDADGEYVYDADGELVYAQAGDDSTGYWNPGDEYEIYITATEDSVISSIWTDKRFGRPTPRKKLSRGLRAEDMDLDEYTKHIFGPGQPER